MLIQSILSLVTFGIKILFIIFLIALFAGISMLFSGDSSTWLFCIAIYGLAIVSIAGKISRGIGAAPSFYGVKSVHSKFDNMPLIGDLMYVMT